MMVENISPVRIVKTQTPAPAAAKVEVEFNDALPQHSEPGQNVEPEIEISQALLNEVQQEIQLMRNVGLQFSVHEATGRTVIRVVDRETEELIREIPPEEFLKLAAKIEEMIGLLLDKKV